VHSFTSTCWHRLPSPVLHPLTSSSSSAASAAESVHCDWQRTWCFLSSAAIIGVDLAGIMWGTHGERPRLVGVAWGGYEEGCPFHSRLGGLGERHKLPQQGPGFEDGFWSIWKPQDALFCIYMTKYARDNLH